MDIKKKIRITVQISLCVAGWFAVMKLCTCGVEKLGSTWPGLLVKILTTMVIPYGILLPIVGIFMKKMEAPEGLGQRKLKPGQLFEILVIQSGLSIFLMFVTNILLTVSGVTVGNQLAGQVSDYFVFYIILLLLFNPIAEEYFFRGLVLKHLRVLGEREAILISACLFALPHVFSQGIAQMFYTFILGMVWGAVMVRTNNLKYVILLHAFSNLYGMFLPLMLMQSQAGMVIYMALWIVIVPVSAVVLCIRKKRCFFSEK
ncbi:MAG: type II CAAX endopeptidase family protein [Lachnospiraceae bacterium]|nr:type II CAAX endopeptidase family protein [Lachnospiraceae bacterium]